MSETETVVVETVSHSEEVGQKRAFKVLTLSAEVI
jgi:hypothetical protein